MSQDLKSSVLDAVDLVNDLTTYFCLIEAVRSESFSLDNRVHFILGLYSDGVEERLEQLSDTLARLQKDIAKLDKR